MLPLLCGKSIIKFDCEYVPQKGISVDEKDRFYEQMLVLVTSVAPLETLVIAGDFNSPVGQHIQDFSPHPGGYDYGTRNQERMRILDICAATDLAATNTFFRNRNLQVITDAIKKMKQRKGGGPSGVIVEMIKAGRTETVTAISELVNQIIHEQNIPEDWKESFIINSHKGKCDAIDRGNCRSLKLLKESCRGCSGKSYLVQR